MSEKGDDREGSPYEYATRAMPSSAQVATTKFRNKLSEGERENVPMPTVPRLRLVNLKAYFNLDRRNRHNLTRHMCICMQKIVKKDRTLWARRIVSARTSDRPM